MSKKEIPVVDPVLLAQMQAETEKLKAFLNRQIVEKAAQRLQKEVASKTTLDDGWQLVSPASERYKRASKHDGTLLEVAMMKIKSKGSPFDVE